MSYDLTVYGTPPAGDGGVDLGALVAAIPGLTLGGAHDEEVTILRGTPSRYAFTVFGPHPIDTEDVPAAALPRVLEPTACWRVIIEGSAASEVPAARRFATGLARTTGGVAVDEQTGDLLGTNGNRRVSWPSGARVDIVELRWFAPAAGRDPQDGPQAWLELAETLLPEALPRRFGNTEPFRYRLDRDGRDRFLDCHREERWLLGFTTGRPAVGGSLGVPSGSPIIADSLSVLAAPLADPRWRTAIRRFFIAYAARRGAILATGELLQGYLLHPGGVSADGVTETRRSMVAPDGVFGLPPDPVWWTWLGNEYLTLVGPRRLIGARRAVGDYLPAVGTRHYPQGAFYAAADAPVHHRDLRRRDDPFPAALRSTAVPVPHQCDEIRPARIRPHFPR